MMVLRRLTKNSTGAPICSVAARYFSAGSSIPSRKPVPSSTNYDELIYAAGRNRDFGAVRDLLSKRVVDGCFNTSNTFKFIATDISVLDDLLRTLAELDNWFARKHAHDALVAQLAKLHRTDEALSVAETVSRKNYGATGATFNPVINALSRKKKMADVWRVVDVMRGYGVKPSVMSFNCILTAYCLRGDVASAADALAKMEAEGWKADAVTYDALVLGACKAGKVEGALVVLRRTMEDGVTALFSSYLHIIKAMVEHGFSVQAVEFVRAFAGRDERLDAENYGFLARCLKNRKRIAEAKSVMEEMMEKGLRIGDGLEDLMDSIIRV